MLQRYPTGDYKCLFIVMTMHQLDLTAGGKTPVARISILLNDVNGSVRQDWAVD